MASRLNPDRTDAPDPISIDDRLLALMREQGMTPGMAKMPGAPMIVANPLYPDPAQAATGNASVGTPEYNGKLPPRRPRNDTSEAPNGGYTGGAKYAGLEQPSVADDNGFTGGAKQAGLAPDDTGGFTGGARYAYSPQGPQQTGTPEQQGPNDYTIPYAVGGGAGLVLTALAAKAALEKRKMRVPAEASVDDYAGPTQRLEGAHEVAQKQAASRVAPTADDYAPTGRMAQMQLPDEAQPELVKPAEFKEPVPEARRVGEAPQTRLGQPTWDQPKGSVPDGGSEIPATREQVVTLDKSGLHVAKSDLDAQIAKSLGERAPTVRGGGTRLRVPRIGR